MVWYGMVLYGMVWWRKPYGMATQYVLEFKPMTKAVTHTR
jgi:hypothetical protein